ncbi:MAG: proprotein convertase P-domain-containing protein [Deltaproteobacteria bacterium]|nr:proprotein convertase P-domain-containing protein [Deltaproteobacteria bacterium]
MRRLHLMAGLAAAVAVAGCATAKSGGDDDGGQNPDVDASMSGGDGGVVGDDAALPDARVIDAQAIDAAPDSSTPRQITDDTAAEFAGGTLTAAVIEPYGAIAPQAYFTGGLLLSASDSGQTGDAAAATWAMVQAFTATGKQSAMRSTDQDFGTAMPAGLGLTSGDSFTVWSEGEIFLEAGTWTFNQLCDDHAFLELAPPGGAFARVVSTNWMAEGSGSFVAATTGWYALRAAYSEDTGGFLWRLRMSGPGFAGPAVIPAHRLRFRADNVDGLWQGGWDELGLMGAHGATIDDQTAASADYGAGMPADLGITAAEQFSLRWAGQFRLDATGAYTFGLSTDDGQRLWIDGAPVAAATAWDLTTHASTTGTMNLSAGWHDLVVDQQENTGGAAARFTVASGPELAGMALPAARTRPVVARGERVVSAVDPTDRAVPDVGMVDSTFTIDAPPGAVVKGLEVGWTFTHAFCSDIEIRVVAPDGTVLLVRDDEGGTGSCTVTEREFHTGLDGKPAAGLWRLRVNDDFSADLGTLQDALLTVHHDGAQPPIALTSAYESAVKDLGPTVASFGNVEWFPRVPAGSSVAVKVRSGATAAACQAATWSAALTDPAGSANPAPPAQFVQYRVELTSNGDAAPSVDAVRLRYTVSP